MPKSASLKFWLPLTLVVALLPTSVFSATETENAQPPADEVAKPQLKDDDEVFARILTTAIANEIRENCDGIAARKIRATFYVLGILSYARKQGFTQAEMEAFRDDVEQQERLRTAAYGYLDENGVDREVPASYCPLGLVEIDNKSDIGRLLKKQ